MNEKYEVYIITNKKNTTSYVGVTNNLVRRIYEHKNHFIKSFSQKYNLDKLVYYELFDNPQNAITREKQLKAGTRKRKIELISAFNKNWLDLYSILVM